MEGVLGKVLIVDDDENICQELHIMVKKQKKYF